MTKKDIKKDFKKALSYSWLNEKIKPFKDYYKENFSNFKCKIELNKEIYINHDFSPEIIEMEEKIERPITCDEYDMLVDEYIKVAIKIINKK